MKAHLIDTHLVPRSRSSAKVKIKYQGHVSQKGISVSQTHLGSLCYTVTIYSEQDAIVCKSNLRFLDGV